MRSVLKTPRPVKAKAPPEPDVLLTMPPPGDTLALLTIYLRGRSYGYWVDRIPSDFGIAYRLEKLQSQGSEVYHVLLYGEESSCTCPGFQWTGRECKHIACCRRRAVELASLPEVRVVDPLLPAAPRPAAAPAPCCALDDF